MRPFFKILQNVAFRIFDENFDFESKTHFYSDSRSMDGRDNYFYLRRKERESGQKVYTFFYFNFSTTLVASFAFNFIFSKKLTSSTRDSSRSSRSSNVDSNVEFQLLELTKN